MLKIEQSPFLDNKRSICSFLLHKILIDSQTLVQISYI